jgi:hypothetical protein
MYQVNNRSFVGLYVYRHGPSQLTVWINEFNVFSRRFQVCSRNVSLSISAAVRGFGPRNWQHALIDASCMAWTRVSYSCIRSAVMTFSISLDYRRLEDCMHACSFKGRTHWKDNTISSAIDDVMDSKRRQRTCIRDGKYTGLYDFRYINVQFMKVWPLRLPRLIFMIIDPAVTRTTCVMTEAGVVKRGWSMFEHRLTSAWTVSRLSHSDYHKFLDCTSAGSSSHRSSSK